MNPEPASAGTIPRATFASLVTDRLRANIVDGSLKPGSQLSEIELATSFGVSRGPVREALQRLVQEGLLLSEPHRGVFVPVLTGGRASTSTSLARHWSRQPSGRSSRTPGPRWPRCVDRLVTLMAMAEAAGDWPSVGNLDLEFHVALVDASGGLRLRRMFTTVISETRLCLGVLTADDARDDLVQEHRLIYDAIKEGDTDKDLRRPQEALR